jgi:glycosyltransferase involved in cell wall biosynthesis
MLNLTRGLASQDQEVAVLAMSTRKHPAKPEKMPEGIRRMATFRFIRVPARITWYGALFNLVFSRKPYTAVRFFSRSFKNEIIHLLNNFRPDVVQLEGLYLCPYIPVIRRHSMAKISYRAHNIESEIWRRSALTSSGLKKAYQQNLSNRIENFEKKWLNRYDLLIPITERDLKRLTQMGNRKPALVIPSGIDMETTATDLAKSEYPSLFHIGSLDWFPNQEGLLWFLDNCWEKVLQKMPDLRLYIAGRKAPGWLVARFGVSNVVFVGEVENAIDFMKSKAFMLVPLLSGSGMRVKIVEGMALGKPVISTSIGAEGIDVTDGHNILIADHPEDFVRAIEMLVTNRPEAERIGTNAKQFMRDHFDNRDITAKLAAFYEKHLK